jgi:hypothetical protein
MSARRKEDIMYKISRPLARSLRCAAKLHSGEEGTAMTEFVICLPIFVIIFIGIADLYRIQNTTVAIQITATADMWKKALPIQKNIAASALHLSAPTSVAPSLSVVNARGGNIVAKGYALGKIGATATYGHFGESYYMTLPLRPFVNMRVPGDTKISAKQVLNTSDGKMTLTLVPDGTLDNASGMWRPPAAAGIRYGMVGSKVEQTVESRLLRNSFNISTGYDTIVSPYGYNMLEHSTLTMITVGQAVNARKLFDSLPGVEFSARFNTN